MSDLQSLFDALDDFLFTVSPAGHILAVNPAMERRLGWSAAELCGRHVLELHAAEHRDQALRVIEEIRSGQTDTCLLPIMTRSGELIDVETKVVMGRWNGQEVTIGLSRDVTQRNRAVEALRREKEFVESLLQTAPAIVLVLDTDCRIVRSNPYIERVTGYRAEELVGRDWCDTCSPPAARAEARRLIQQTLADQRDTVRTRPLLTRSGAIREVEWTCRVLCDGAGKSVGMLALGRDVTDLKAAQERAVQAERLAAIGQMMAGLAHESGNALQRSQACLEMLTLELRDRPVALDLVYRIQRAQDHLHHLYEEVRGYASPIALHCQRLPVPEILSQAWSHLEPLWRSHSASFDSSPGDGDWTAPIDSHAMESVFRNVLENALSASPVPAAIDVGWSHAEFQGRAAVRVTIRDHGPGLTREQQQRIFEPFFTTKLHGTGLGMAIARRFVEAHGGGISAGNAATGSGAEIDIVLPRS